MKMLERIKNLSWQEKVAIAAVIVVLIIEYFYFSTLKHLPGPIYGGDLYAHLGFTQNYLSNGFWTDPYFVGEYAFYPWLGNIAIAVFSFITGSSLMVGMKFFPLVITLFSSMAYWFLGKQVFKSDTYALVTMLASITVFLLPGPAPNNLAWFITIPFFLYFWLRTEEVPSLKNKALAGLFLGLTSLVQVAFFLSALSIFFFTIAIETILRWKAHSIKDAFKKYAPILFVGFLVSLPFYGVTIVNYHGETKNPLFQYNGPDVDLLGIGWVAKEVVGQFYTTSNMFRLAFGIVALLGLYVAAKNFRKQSPRFVLLWFIIGFLVPLHHLITRPLFDRWILPTHLFGTAASYILFFAYGIMLLFSMFDGWFDKNKARYAKIALVAIILIPLIFTKVDAFNNDRWVQYGRQIDPLTGAWLDAGEWIKANTDINSVFLAYDESCFAMNGVSGRKCVAVRRTHANYFVDIEERYADAVVMLYGKDLKVVDGLISKYDLEYFLLDPYLLQGYWKINPKYEGYLKQNGVSYEKGRDRLDPSVPDARQFDLLLVPSQNITLQNRLEAVQAFGPRDQPVIMIFRVK